MALEMKHFVLNPEGTDLFTSEAVAEILIGAEEGKKPLHYRVENDVVVGVSGWQNAKSGIKTADPAEEDRIGTLERSNEALRARLKEGVDMVAGLCNNIEDVEPRLRRAIKIAVESGKPWTDEAQAVFDDAIAALDRLVGSENK